MWWGLIKVSASSTFELSRSVTHISPSHRARNLTTGLFVVGLVISLGVVVPVASKLNWSAPGTLADVIGMTTAMAGTYLALVLLLLMARLPWLEHKVGQDVLTYWHSRLGPTAVILIVVHVIFTTLSYAQSVDIGWWEQFVLLVFSYPWMLPATAALLIMVVFGLLSMRRIRRHFKYDTWKIAHLYFYLAVALAFGHQVIAGSFLQGNTFAMLWWIGLYVIAGGTIIIFRAVLVAQRAIRHDLKVDHVERESNDTVSVYLRGKNLDTWNAFGGQWFTWHFATSDWWWQGHPYSLSAAPTNTGMRILVKNLGDQSGAIDQLKPGTRVFAEGPYGAFSLDRRTCDRLIFIAGGVGVAPIRALLDEVPAQAQVDVIYRSLDEPVPLRAELEAIAQDSQGRIRVHIEVGLPQEHPIDAQALAMLIPDFGDADVFICGPPGFTEVVRTASEQLGVPASRFHSELFAF
jgi:predicted ferric reductase